MQVFPVVVFYFQLSPTVDDASWSLGVIRILTVRRRQRHSVFLSPANWVYVGRGGVHPEVIHLVPGVEVDQHPVVQDVGY